MFLVSKPASKWTDSDRIAAEYKLSTLIANIRELEKLRTSYEGANIVPGDSEVYMLSSVKAKNGAINEIVVVDKKLKKVIKNYKESILDIVQDPALDKKTSLAVLAEVVNEFFDKQKPKKEKPKAKSIREDSNEVA
jgi:hypothetical protein